MTVIGEMKMARPLLSWPIAYEKQSTKNRAVNASVSVITMIRSIDTLCAVYKLIAVISLDVNSQDSTPIVRCSMQALTYMRAGRPLVVQHQRQV